MKRWHALVLMILVGLAAEVSAADIPIGVAWQGKSGMADRVFKGFQQALNELAPDIKPEVRKDLADETALNAAVEDFEKTKKGMVILRSNGAIMLAKRTLRIPAFIGGCNNPVELGVAESLVKPKANMTGVTYYIPAKVKLETFKSVYPPLREFLLLVEEGNPSSPIDASETQADAPGLGLSGRTVSCKTLDEAIAAVTKAGPDSVFIIGSQALLLDNADKVVQAAGPRPVFAYSERPVEVGALCGVVADDLKLGRMLGAMVAEVLVQGKNIANMPIQTDPKPKLFINARAAERLKVQIPYEVLNLAQIVEK